MASENHFFYWTFVDLATKLYNSLWNQDVLFVGRAQDGSYLDVKCVNRADIQPPFQVIRLDYILSDTTLMKEFLSYGYREALEEYIDDATR